MNYKVSDDLVNVHGILDIRLLGKVFECVYCEKHIYGHPAPDNTKKAAAKAAAFVGPVVTVGLMKFLSYLHELFLRSQ